MKRLYLLRHGETTWNKEGRIQGHLDPPLSRLGVEQAHRLADRLAGEAIDAVFSSDLQRARVTAEVLAAGHGLPVRTTRLLREACLGCWQGLTADEVLASFPEQHKAYREDPVANRPRGAESLDEVIARCDAFLHELRTQESFSVIAVTCHGGSVRGLIAAALGLGPGVYRRLRFDNAGLTVLDLRSIGPMVTTLNDVCHLHRDWAVTDDGEYEAG